MDLEAKARKLFSSDLYATKQTGIYIEKVDTDSATCSFDIDPCHRNAKGAVMGGALFTLADYAFAVAVHADTLSKAEEPTDDALEWVTTSSTINYLSTSSGNKISAHCRKIKKGNRQAVYQTFITDDTGKTLAHITTTGSKK